MNKGRALLNEGDEAFQKTRDPKVLDETNEKVAKMAIESTKTVLRQVLQEASLKMKNGYQRFDN